MSKNRKSNALSAGIGYTIGNILIKGINFLSIPLFSRIMTPAELGVYSAFAAYDSILFMFISLTVHTSVKNAKYVFEGELDQYTSSVSMIICMNALVTLGLAAIFSKPLSALMDLPVSALYLLVLESFGSAILSLYNCRISLDYNFKGYLAAAFANTVGNLAISIFLICTIFSSQRDLGRIIGASISIFVVSIALLVVMYRRARPKYDKKYWQYAVRYSLPLIPHGLSQVLLAQFDRVMIRMLVNDAAAGIYSVVANISMVLTIIVDSVSNAWTTWFYESFKAEKHDEIRERASQLTAVFIILTVGLMAISPELVWILGGSQYEVGKYVAIPLILSVFAVFLYNVVIPVEYYHEKTTYIMFGTLAAGVLDIILNYIFIKEFGFIAAAYTTLAAYALYAMLHFLISRKLAGYLVLPMKMVVLSILTLLLTSVLDLVFISSIWIRYAVCAVVIVPMAIVLLKQIKKERM